MCVLYRQEGASRAEGTKCVAFLIFYLALFLFLTPPSRRTSPWLEYITGPHRLQGNLQEEALWALGLSEQMMFHFMRKKGDRKLSQICFPVVQPTRKDTWLCSDLMAYVPVGGTDRDTERSVCHSLGRLHRGLALQELEVMRGPWHSPALCPSLPAGSDCRDCTLDPLTQAPFLCSEVPPKAISSLYSSENKHSQISTGCVTTWISLIKLISLRELAPHPQLSSTASLSGRGTSYVSKSGHMGQLSDSAPS